MKIGLPGGLFYYSYYPLWKTFFEELGAEIVTSGTTTKGIMDNGVKLCVDEACFPVKVYHGHVKHLADRVDAVFVPRIMSISKNEYICPKFCGLPEMIKNSVPGLPYIIDAIVNLRKSDASALDSAMEAAASITSNRGRVINAYRSALSVQKEFNLKLKETGDFEGVLAGKAGIVESGSRCIGLLGHPYNIYDSYINMDIRKKLADAGYRVVTPEMLEDEDINKSAGIMPKRHFWTLGRRILGAGLSLLEKNTVRGFIYLSSFGCGIDSLMEDYLERQLRRRASIPYMKLVLDEHSGEAGQNTRLEAFLDMVKRREENEGNFSPHGGNLCSRQGLS
jgi:predicted nucleotide-binding protein (sugar kinase/HSP70/actin superfamily)